MKRKVIFLTALFLLVWIGVAWTEPVENAIYYTKKHGNGTYTFRFSLWDAQSGGTEIWSEEKSLKVTGSLIKTYLGDTNPLDGIDFSQQYWIQVERLKNLTYILVGVNEKFSVVPYALHSQTSSETITPVPIPIPPPTSPVLPWTMAASLLIRTSPWRAIWTTTRRPTS